MKIRKYNPEDQSAVESIHFETGFLGKPMSAIISRRDLWAGFIAEYFREPKSIFVVENDGKVVGYLLGCLDDSKHAANTHFVRWTFANFFRSLFLTKKDRIFWRNQLIYIFNIMLYRSGELKQKHPLNAGHLHINFLPEARGKGVGSKLLNKFIRYAGQNGVTVIHADSFDTIMNPNKNFWLKNGFKEYSKVKTLCWKKQLPDEKIFLTCYYKKL